MTKSKCKIGWIIDGFNYELGVMNYKFSSSKYAILFFLTFIFSYTFASNAILNDFQQEFGIQIILEDTFESTYENVNYNAVLDTQTLNNYIQNILTAELKKYPKSYFEKIGLKHIVLCTNLALYSQKRAAIPDPIKNTLFLSIENIYGSTYLIHVLHHEMHHISEYAQWQDMFYVWRKWQRKNTKQFTYGTGGQFAYIDGNEMVDWYKINNPELGFVNLYSTLGPEEDRCEIVSLIMTDAERPLLLEFMKTDKYLKRKINLSLKSLSLISGEKMKYWKAKLKP